MAEPQNLFQWIDENRHLLKPPVGNKLVYGAGQLKVMIVGGPNQRADFHIEEGEELFYMIKGDMRLDIIEKGELRQIPIHEGEMFLLPPRIPHSPQRFPDSVGLVIERERAENENDGMRWYVPGTTKTLHEEWFHCYDLGTQLGPVIQRFFASEAHRTNVPQQEFGSAPVAVDTVTTCAHPFLFSAWAAGRLGGSATAATVFESEFHISAHCGDSAWPFWQCHDGEVLFLQFRGAATVTTAATAAADGGCGGDDVAVEVPQGNVLLLPAATRFSVQREAGSLGIVVTNRVVVPPAAAATTAPDEEQQDKAEEAEEEAAAAAAAEGKE